MIRRVNYTKPTQLPEIRSNRTGATVLFPKTTSLDLMLVTSFPGNPFPDIVSTIKARTIACMSTFPGKPIDWNKLIDISWYTWGDGMISGSEGAFAPNLSFNTSDMIADSFGTFIEGCLRSANTSNITADSHGDMWLDVEKLNWIAWSDVGSLDFTQSRKNVAGAMPMDWQGSVYGIRKHGNVFVVLGANGVSIITPTGALMGLNTIHKIGLIGRDAFAGDDSVLYFIDNLGILYSLADELIMLDYREYLSLMTNPVLTFDTANNLLYICDGTLGYIYSPDSRSLGAGSVNVTGIYSKSGALYVAAPGVISIPTASIVTDIYDFGTRKLKTIYSLNFGTNLTETLQAAIESRTNKASDFVSTAFKEVAANGNVKIIKKGIEFRFKLEGVGYEDFALDYFNVGYKIHEH